MQAAALHKRIGTTLGGRYKITALLGEDGLGTTYLVEHIQLRKRMALKILGSELMQNPELVARFEREALATAHLAHPNIVAATDLGRTEDDALYLVLEYFEGKSLRSVLESGALPLVRVLPIARHIISALVCAHAAGLLHLDLTPENILLVPRPGAGDTVKVVNFGLAQIRTEALLATKWDPTRSQAATRHATAFGSPTYMAPEQAVGGEVDVRTDLYSVGVVLYELLTGKPPFPVVDPSQLLKQHLVGKVPPFSESAPALKVPAALERLIIKLLEKSPDNRPAGAQAVQVALDEIMSGEGLSVESALSPTLPVVPGAAPIQSTKDALAADLLEADERGSPATTPLAQALADLASQNPVPAANDPDPESPLAAALQAGPSVPPPLRAPSIVDLTHLKPDAANSALLAPATAPSPGERVVSGSKEAVRLGREVLWPTVKTGYERARTVSRAYGLRGWNFGLRWLRPRLPANLHGVAPAILGLTVGAVFMLPVMLILILSSAHDDSPKRPALAVAAPVGYASEREMERGVAQGAGALKALVAKYPIDARCHRALVLAYATKKDYVEALRALVPLLQLDPSAQTDEALGKVVADAALVPEISESAIAFLETALGDHGIDVLLDLADRTTTEPFRTRFNQSLTKDAVRKLAAPEALLLLDLRAAGRCEQKKALLPRAGQHGGTRVQRYLRGLQTTTGCGPGAQSDCWPCLRRGLALQNAITAIDQRGGAPG